MRVAITSLIVLAAACRAAPELPAPAAEHPASAEVTEAVAPELKGASSRLFEPASSTEMPNASPTMQSGVHSGGRR